MVKILVRPTVNLDDKQQADSRVKISSDHGNATYSVTLTDSVLRNGGDIQNGLRLGVRLQDGSLEAVYGEERGREGA